MRPFKGYIYRLLRLLLHQEKSRNERFHGPWGERGLEQMARGPSQQKL